MKTLLVGSCPSLWSSCLLDSGNRRSILHSLLSLIFFFINEITIYIILRKGAETKKCFQVGKSTGGVRIQTRDLQVHTSRPYQLDPQLSSRWNYYPIPVLLQRKVTLSVFVPLIWSFISPSINENISPNSSRLLAHSSTALGFLSVYSNLFSFCWYCLKYRFS